METAIYDSKPWIVDHEGPTKIDMKGTGHRQKNKVSFDFTDNDFWFTQKENKVYVISLSAPKTSTISIVSIKDLDIKSVRLVGKNTELRWEKTNEALKVQLPKLGQEIEGYALEIVQ